MDTFEMAKALVNGTDEEFAEVFAYLNRFHEAKGLINNSDPLTQDEMDFNTHEVAGWIENSLKEIIFSEEVDTTAWWKDDKFFGRNTPKAKFLAQSEEVKQRLLMETAMRGQEIFEDMYNDGLVEAEGTNSASVWEFIKDQAYEFEYNHYESEDFTLETDTFFTKKFLEKFAHPKMVTMTVYISDIIENYEDDNLTEITLKQSDAIEWWNSTGRDKEVKSFQYWYDNNYTTDDTVGLYAWLKANNKKFTVKGNLVR